MSYDIFKVNSVIKIVIFINAIELNYLTTTRSALEYPSVDWTIWSIFTVLSTFIPCPTVG